MLSIAFHFLLVVASASGAPTAKPGFDFSAVEALPVQGGGRVKPLSTFSNEVVLFIAARRTFTGFSATELLFSWVTEPNSWMNERFIKISHPDVKKQLLLASDQVKFSPHELMSNVTVMQYFNEFQARNTVKQKGTKPDVRERELERVFKSLMTFDAVVSGTAFAVLPRGQEGPWGTLAKEEQERALSEPIYKEYRALIQAYSTGDQAGFSETAKKIWSHYPAPIQKGLKLEAFYNRLHPESWAWKLYLLVSLLWGAVLFAPASKKVKKLQSVGTAVFILGVASHLASMGLRVAISGRPPVTNMYESILWVALGILGFALYLYAKSKKLQVMLSAVILATVAVVAAEAAPTLMDPTIQPLVPVLRSNAWLMIHVLIITLSYSAFAVSLGLANANLWYFWTRKPAAAIEGLHQLMYRAMQIGVVMLATGTILGGVWADYSWGRFWGWDPKETWALIALLAYLAILHARYIGWVKRFSFTAMTVVAFLTVLMAWYGVNFVLGAGLHSYGFSAGGQGWVAAFCLLELAAVVAVYLRVRGGSVREGIS